MNVDNANSQSMHQAAADEIQPAGDERDLSDNLQINKHDRTRGKSKASRKRSPRVMRIVLDALTERPILSYAAKKAGIHFKTLQYWLKCSKAGHEDYDLQWQGFKGRFHEHCEWAIEQAHDVVRDVVVAIAMGYQIKTDPFFVEVLDCRGLDAFVKEENGEFIMEPGGPPNPKMLRFYLEWRYPEKYGKLRKIETPQTGRTGHWHASKARRQTQAEYGGERQDESMEVGSEKD